MTDTPSTEIDLLLQQMQSLDERSSRLLQPLRFVVATNWSHGAAPLAILQAYRRFATVDMPMQLVFAVPHEPNADDAQCVAVLLEGAGLDESLTGLEVSSFDDVVEASYDSAVVPTGNTEELILQVARMTLRIEDVARRFASGDWNEHTLQDDPTLNMGDKKALRQRLADFTS